MTSTDSTTTNNSYFVKSINSVTNNNDEDFCIVGDSEKVLMNPVECCDIPLLISVNRKTVCVIEAHSQILAQHLKHYRIPSGYKKIDGYELEIEESKSSIPTKDLVVNILQYVYSGFVKDLDKFATYYREYIALMNAIKVPLSRKLFNLYFSILKSSWDQTIQPIAVGQKVKALWKGATREYDAKVVAVNEDGTLSLEYADGDTDREVPRTNLPMYNIWDLSVSPITKLVLLRTLLESLFASLEITESQTDEKNMIQSIDEFVQEKMSKNVPWLLTDRHLKAIDDCQHFLISVKDSKFNITGTYLVNTNIGYNTILFDLYNLQDFPKAYGYEYRFEIDEFLDFIKYSSFVDKSPSGYQVENRTELDQRKKILIEQLRYFLQDESKSTIINILQFALNHHLPKSIQFCNSMIQSMNFSNPSNQLYCYLAIKNLNNEQFMEYLKGISL